MEGLGALPADAFVRAVWRRAANLIQQVDVAPVLREPAKEKRMSSPVAQFQILSKDPDRASQFYGSVFGWSVDAANALGYRQVSTGLSGLMGGIWPAPPEAQPFVQLFVAVDDVAATIERARSLGARVIVPHQRLPDGDELAILADPEGISFGVMLRRTAEAHEMPDR